MTLPLFPEVALAGVREIKAVHTAGASIEGIHMQEVIARGDKGPKFHTRHEKNRLPSHSPHEEAPKEQWGDKVRDAVLGFIDRLCGSNHVR
jgi:hypothetical protein